MPVFVRRFFLLVCLFIIAVAPGAYAQAPEDMSKRLDGLSIVLDSIETTLQRDGVSDEEIRKARDGATDIAASANNIALALQPNIVELTDRLNALRPETPDSTEPRKADQSPAPGEADAEPPAETAPPEEPDTLSRELREIETALSFEEGLARRARAIATRADQIAAHAAAIERDRFTRRIFQHDRSILDPSFWPVIVTDLPVAWSGAKIVIHSIYERFLSRGALAIIPVFLFLVSLAIVTLTSMRRLIGNWISRLFGPGDPSELSKAIVAILSALLIIFIPLIGLYLARLSAIWLDLAAPTLLTLFNTAAVAVLTISVSTGLARGILAPSRPEWRLAVAEQGDVESLIRYVQLTAVVGGLGVLLNGIASAANAPHSTIVFVGVTICLVFAWLLWTALKPLRSILERQTSDDEDHRVRFSRLARLYGFIAVGGVFIIAGGALIGFVPLAWFLVKQFVWVAFILATYGLLSNVIDAYSTGLRSDDGSPGQIARFLGLSERTVTQVTTVAFGIAKIFFASVALIAVAAPWGLKSNSFVEQTRSLLAGFQVGELVISPTAIIEAAAIFFLGLLVTRMVRSWLGERFLTTTRLDPGLKNSITTTIGYIGFIVSVVIAFAFIGIDLSQLGLVAGALSVGIGFGLQSIVNNFVSGLILLAERPIKAGDWIIVAGEEGIVKKINVRATEVETFDRATVVIPNSDLISGTVRNWVLSGSMGRASLVIGVGYGSDADQVREILLACAHDHELVLPYPEPAVFFLDFGDSALMFRLDVYLADIGNGFQTRSDLRFDLLRRFREAGIEIPFPQRDLNIRGSEELDSLISRIKE